MPSREAWGAIVGDLVIINGVAWRRGRGGTFCTAVARPLVAAVPAGEWLLAAGLVLLWHHIVSPISREHT